MCPDSRKLRGPAAGAWEPGFFPPDLGQCELCPPFQQPRLGMPSTRSLWPELMGTGRPGPPAWQGPVSYFGHVYGWDKVPSWTLKSRGEPSTDPGWLCLRALPSQ